MIASGPITQICWVTDDLEATGRLLERVGPQVRELYAAVKNSSQEDGR